MGVIRFLATTFLIALVVLNCYNWFLIDQFHLAPITYLEALGIEAFATVLLMPILILIVFQSPDFLEHVKNKSDTFKSWNKTIVQTLCYLFLFAYAFTIHYFQTK